MYFVLFRYFHLLLVSLSQTPAPSSAKGWMGQIAFIFSLIYLLISSSSIFCLSLTKNLTEGGIPGPIRECMHVQEPKTCACSLFLIEGGISGQSNENKKYAGYKYNLLQNYSQIKVCMGPKKCMRTQFFIEEGISRQRDKNKR